MREDWIEQSLRRFSDLAGARVVTIDMHTAGEPVRIVLRAPHLPHGSTMLERRRSATSTWESYRRLLMHEPRGHADMYGAIITPPERGDSQFGVLFTHNEGYSSMCGHAVIALGRAARDLGWICSIDDVNEVSFAIDTPAGQVLASVGPRSCRFENVPSYVVCLDQKLDVPELGAVEFDIAYGGAFYAFVDATAVGLDLNRCDLAELSIRGMAIKRAIARQLTLTHPTSPDLAFLYGTIFTGPAQADHAFSRHACVFAEGAVDRSPTGTGVAARLAIMVARGQSRLSEHHHFESLTGVCFRGRAVRQVDHHGVRAIIPEIAGSAAFTGQHTFLLEPDDPLPQGFWARPMP